jgi:hypothetical protein
MSDLSSPEFEPVTPDLVAAARRSVADVVWPEATGIRARGDRRRTQYRATAATLTAMFVVLAAATTAIAAPMAERPVPGTSSGPVVPTTTATAEPTGSSTPSPTGVPSLTALPLPARILRQGTFSHIRWPSAMAVGDGSLFAAFTPQPNSPQSPGEMVRINAQTMAVTARWPIAAHAVAVAVTSSYVWVASDDGAVTLGQPSTVGANEVQQFDLNGNLQYTYPVNVPVGLAPDGDTVWVLFGPTPGYVAHALLGHLHNGVVDPPTGLSGGSDPTDSRIGRPLVVCPDGVYVGTYGASPTALVIDHIVNGQIVEHGSPPTTYVSPVLTCGKARGVLIVGSSDGVDPPFTWWPMFLGITTANLPVLRLPDSARPISASSTVVWLQGNGGYSALDKDLNPIDTPITLDAAGISTPFSGYFTSVAPGGDNLWVVACSDAPANVCIVVDLAPH